MQLKNNSAAQTGAKAARAGPPPHASAQRDKILRLLREAKLRGQGVSRADLIFQHRYTQCAARIFELEKHGYAIEHRSIPDERFVTYFLVSEPSKPAPEKDRPELTGLPLFELAVRQ
jgi:hypothetical protein